MNILLTAIIFLLLCCTGLLALIYWHSSRDAGRVIEVLERVAEGHREHVNAVVTVMLNSEQQGVREILKELQKGAQDRRALLEYVLSETRSPESGEQPASGPVSSSARNVRVRTTPGASTLPPDAPTPQSGFPVGELLRETRKGRE